MKLKEMYQAAKAAGKKDICRFMRDMKKAGVKMRWYQGRYMWKGPGVDVDHLGDGYNKTMVTCQHDNMGRGWIVYPVQSL